MLLSFENPLAYKKVKMCVLPLKPFIQEQEGMDKTSINNIIDMLVEHYVNSQLVKPTF